MQRVVDKAVVVSGAASAVLVIALLVHVRWGTVALGTYGYLRAWDSEFYLGSGTRDESRTVELSGQLAGIVWMRVLPAAGSNAPVDWLLRVPYAHLALLAAVAPAVRLVRRMKGAHQAARRRRRGLCPSCGYDLRASPERCPECGAIADHGHAAAS